MLQRAASNAYSWWWASHIRTKQSKWMEQHLLDFQEKVEAVMKLLQEDGDSFAKRANMYYKGRPELINFVEESYRAYRALAERYDHISKELQNANNTIASICPEQVPFMDEDDEDGSPKAARKAAPPEGFKPSNNNAAAAAPKVPQPPRKDLKTVITSATKKYCTKKVVKASAPKEPIKSGLSKKEALAEIDRLQKEILTLQTVKEFVKSTYDNAIQKYWDTEEEIKRLQERVSLLHDEFGEGMIIEDDVARRLMTEAALRTCQETLTCLRVKQERSFEQTKIENTRVKAVKEKLEALMQQLNYDQFSRPEPRARKNVKKVVKENLDEEVEKMNQQRKELQLLQTQIKEQLAAGSSESISVSEMAEKIDELVNKVISLETSVSSQEALVTRLRAATDELQSQIVTLEDDKASLIDEKHDLTAKLREMDEKMQDIQDLNGMVETQKTDLQAHFTEALCDLDHLSEEVPIAKLDERDKILDLSKKESELSGEAVSQQKVQSQDKVPIAKPDERNKIPDLSKRESEPSSETVSKHEVQRRDEVSIVKPDERDKIVDLSKRESEASGEAVSKHEVQRRGEVPIVKPDGRDKISDLSKRESELSNEAISEHEIQRCDEVLIVKLDERDKILDLSKRESESLSAVMLEHEVQRRGEVPIVKPYGMDKIPHLSKTESEPSSEAVSKYEVQRRGEVPIVESDGKDRILDLLKRESEPLGEVVLEHEVQRRGEVPIVKLDGRDKIPDLSKRESEPSGETVSEHEVQREDEVPIVKLDRKDKILDLSKRESEPSDEVVSRYEVQRQDEVPIVKSDGRDKIPDLSKRESKPSGEAVSKHKVQRQDEILIVKPDGRDKIRDLSKRGNEPSNEATSEYEVQRQDALNQENVLINDLESDKKPKVSGLVDKYVQKDNKIDAPDFADNNVQKDNKINDVSLGKDRETNVTGLVDNVVKKDNEIKVTDSLENEAKSDNKLTVTESSEKEEASSTEGQSRFTVFKTHFTNFISLTQLRAKEQEKTPNTGNNDSLARSASSITTGDQDLIQHKENKESNSYSDSFRDQKEKITTQSSSETENAHEVHSQEQTTAKKDDNAHEVHSQEQATAGEEEPNWRQLFMDGLKDKERLLLTEYTNILRNYKDMKKTLSQLEKKNEEILFDTSLKLKELKSSNALKDEEIKLLRQKLGLMERSLEANVAGLKELRAMEEPIKKGEEEDDDDDDVILKVRQPDSTISAIEERFRRSIDELLEENLGFWLKFSTTFTEIQRFQTTIKDLQSDVSKLEESAKSESVRQSMKSEARPIFMHLLEIQTELSVWLEKGASLKEELQHRSASLCEIQEEITIALKASAEDYDFKFTSFQAAKFQGEVLNMKQENNKVADELQAGLDHVSSLQSEVEKVLTKMGEQYGFITSKKPRNTAARQPNSNSSDRDRGNRNRSQVPLGAFIFGVKPKKQKHSIFAGISPGINKKYRAAVKGQHL